MNSRRNPLSPQMRGPAVALAVAALAVAAGMLHDKARNQRRTREALPFHLLAPPVRENPSGRQVSGLLLLLGIGAGTYWWVIASMMKTLSITPEEAISFAKKELAKMRGHGLWEEVKVGKESQWSAREYLHRGTSGGPGVMIYKVTVQAPRGSWEFNVYDNGSVILMEN